MNAQLKDKDPLAAPQTVDGKTYLVDFSTGELIVLDELDQDQAEIKTQLFGKKVPPILRDKPTEEELAQLKDAVNAASFKIASLANITIRKRAQVEAVCKPIDTYWQFLFNHLKPWAEVLAKETLPKHGPKSKKAGEYSAKTLELDDMAFAYRKGGGMFIKEDGEAETVKWCLQNAKDPEIKACIKMTVDTKRLVELVKERGLYAQLPFMDEVPVNEFKFVSPKFVGEK